MKNQSTRFFLIFLIIAVSAWAWANQGIRYGLDLAGGGSLTYRVEVGAEIDAKDKIGKVVEVLSNRLNSAGMGGISIVATEQQEIVIDIPGRSREQLKPIQKLIEANGELEFRMLAPETVTRELLEQKRSLGPYFDLAEQNAQREFPEPHLRIVPFPEAPGGEGVVLIPEAPYEKRVEELKAAGASEDEIQQAQIELSRVRKREVFTGADLTKTAVQRQQIQLVVFFEMRTQRKADFGDFTERGIDKQMAIILDGEISSAPIINSKLPGSGVITGGGSGFSKEEARDLSIVLESGATGAKMIRDRVEVLGPSLGADAISTGKLSVLIGFIAVLITMLWLYRVPGIVANAALIMNVVILIGALAFFHAALTLAGIAGVVLTLGMAVDANILIFERLKEERARGKSVAEALAAGYDRALVAIVDANVTTVLTAVVLIVLGSGTVKGFGVTLTIGILASMFTAIFVTRTIFEWALGMGIIKELNFGSERKKTTIDFMSVRRWFTGPSLILMVLGFGFFMSRDEADSKDLEFIGGQQAIIQLKEAISPDQARSLARGAADLVWPADQAWPEDLSPLPEEVIGPRFYEDAAPVRIEPEGIDEPPPEHSNRWLIKTKVTEQREGQRFLLHLETAFADLLVPPAFSDFDLPIAEEGGPAPAASGVVKVISPDASADALQEALENVRARASDPVSFADVSVTPVEGDKRAFHIRLTPVTPKPTLAFVKDQIRQAAQSLEPPVLLSDAMPSVSFLNPSRAEQLWRTALEAVLLAMLLQVVYIRLRFADFKHGFAAVCALIHDVTIAIGTVALVDALGLVHAKINLVLIAAFLTLIGYSMNDTIVVFDRIRENMGRSKVVRSGIVNQALNETLARSIRTSITTWVVVAIQFFLNLGKGSVLEGFAWVMVVGVISGTYSSIFIAAPLLLFLPVFWRHFSARPKVATLQVIAMLIGGVMVVTGEGHGVKTIAGIVLASNIGLQFVWHLVPWLKHENPDDLLQEEIQAEAKDRPLAAPGI